MENVKIKRKEGSQLILLRRFVILRSKATKNLDFVERSSEILRFLRSLRMTQRMICRSSIKSDIFLNNEKIKNKGVRYGYSLRNSS